jgi:deoxycytidylate deaminase
MERSITAFDLEMYALLEELKQQSKCIDKQVACIIVDNISHEVLATGINTVIECDKNCHDKEHRVCNVRHAEVSAIEHFDSDKYKLGERTAYVSLFPCKACQEAILPYVDEIVTFGMIHKDWVSGDKLTVFPHIEYTLLNHNGKEKQLSIAQGELAELITSISDVFSRNDKDKTDDDLIDELIDVELQIKLIKIIAQAQYPDLYNKLRAARSAKYAGLLARYAKYGKLSYTS